MALPSNNATSEPMNELVLVVHGVGDPAPGETISLLARSTCSASRPMVETHEVLWLHEDSDRGRFATSFPVHLRSSKSVNHRTVFAEVFWGDLSQLRRGIIGTFRGLLELVFGLRYVAFVAADQSGNAARLLQWLGLVSARALHGPLLAVNLVLALIMLAMAVTEVLSPQSSDKAAWSSILVFIVVSTTLLAAVPVWRMAPNRIQERFWFWVMITAAYLGVVLVLNHLPTLGGNVNNFDDVANIFQGEENRPSTEPRFPHDSDGKPIIESTADPRTLQPIKLVSGDSQDDSLIDGPPSKAEPVIVEAATIERRVGVDPTRQMNWYARLLIVTMGMLWFSLMLMLIVMAGAWMVARLNPKANRRGLDVALLLPLVAIGGWGQFLPIIWLCGQNALSKVGKIEQFDNLFAEAVPLLGIQCVMCVLMGLVQILVFIYYAIWRPRNDVENYSAHAKPPRLIVNFWVQATTAVCACVAIALILALGWNEITITGKPHDCVGGSHNWLWETIGKANKYAIGFLVPLTGLFFVAFRYLSSALDVVLDVVNHFHFRRSSDVSEGLKFEDECEGTEMSFDSGRLYFSKRAMMQARMVQILEHFRCTTPKSRLVLTIVSHSQGTMLAIEVLNSPKLDWLRESFSEIRLVTMGSPFTHVFQHYFSHNYPALDQPYWSNLRQRVDNWYNIFRVDDFVGTVIDFPETLRSTSGFNCYNFPIKRCGHNNYWSDKQVIDLMRKQAGFAWVADVPNVATADALRDSAEIPLRRAG